MEYASLIILGGIVLFSFLGTIFVIGIRRSWSYRWGGGLMAFSGVGALYISATESWVFAGFAIAIGVMAGLAAIVFFIVGGHL